MLKRQRPSSPFPISAEVPLAAEPSLDIDIFERITKRARRLAPLSHRVVQKESTGVLDTDGEDELEDEGRSEYTRGQTRWQEEAGLYKTANTLLHDLHAEQRHRHLFSTSPQNPLHLNTPMGTKHTPQTAAPTRQASQSSSSHQPSWRTYDLMENVEAQNVMSQYEQTNRFLGDLFLTRRRRLEAQQA